MTFLERTQEGKKRAEETEIGLGEDTKKIRNDLGTRAVGDYSGLEICQSAKHYMMIRNDNCLQMTTIQNIVDS